MSEIPILLKDFNTCDRHNIYEGFDLCSQDVLPSLVKQDLAIGESLLSPLVSSSAVPYYELVRKA